MFGVLGLPPHYIHIPQLPGFLTYRSVSKSRLMAGLILSTGSLSLQRTLGLGTGHGHELQMVGMLPPWAGSKGCLLGFTPAYFYS